MGINPAVLIVDDEEDLIGFLKPILERNGFFVLNAKNGKEAFSLVKKSKPDLIVSDVIMSEMDGRELLRVLRREKIFTPVILLTQVSEPFEKVLALEEGADDYLNKPFEPAELIARIRAVLRRTKNNTTSLNSSWKLKSGSLLIDRRKRHVYLNEEEIRITPKAYAVLEFLMTHPDEIVLRKTLLTAVWEWDDDTETRTLSNRIAELRRVLKDDSESPVFIETVSGQGYRFLQPVENIS